ncbi:MAG TPA: neutral zinc metallopeptidase [Acidimicrobiales bacterium]
MRPQRRLIVLLLTGALVLAGCGGGDGGGGRRDLATTDQTTATTSPEQEVPDNSEDALDPETEAKIQELVADADAAVSVVNQFWVDHWSDYFTGTYVPPDIYGGYFGNDSPTCGGQPTDGAGNAFYCPAEDYLAWDWEFFAALFDDAAVGDSFVYLTIAHEWGHVIQERLDVSLVSLSEELQADCLAGAEIAGAVADGYLELEPGDRGEIFQSFAVVADEYEWGNVADHGAADERIEAYQAGEAGGVEYCLPEDSNPVPDSPTTTG